MTGEWVCWVGMLGGCVGCFGGWSGACVQPVRTTDYMYARAVCHARCAAAAVEPDPVGCQAAGLVRRAVRPAPRAVRREVYLPTRHAHVRIDNGRINSLQMYSRAYVHAMPCMSRCVCVCGCVCACVCACLGHVQSASRSVKSWEVRVGTSRHAALLYTEGLIVS